MKTAKLSERLGRRLQTTRLEAGLTQREAAKRAGITAVYLCQLEHGDAKPSIELLWKLAEVLGTTAGGLLG
jgi:transcriptional regulator with XRE-family HTH domain